MGIDPKLSLAIDNRFASKRWTRPADWMQLIKDLGITLVEASADTECDPLYLGEACDYCQFPGAELITSNSQKARSEPIQSGTCCARGRATYRCELASILFENRATDAATNHNDWITNKTSITGWRNPNTPNRPKICKAAPNASAR